MSDVNVFEVPLPSGTIARAIWYATKTHIKHIYVCKTSSFGAHAVGSIEELRSTKQDIDDYFVIESPFYKESKKAA